MDQATARAKVKRHGGLFDELVTFEHLHMASLRACRKKRSRPDVASFYFSLENEIIRIQKELVGHRYTPQPYTEFEIREPKVRKICSSAFTDRVVHHAICGILEPIFESLLIFNTYACRQGKGTHRALAKCQKMARQSTYFLKCDFKKYFESIDHGILKGMLKQTIKDKKFLALLDIIIDHQVPGAQAGRGLPIGNLTSQHFANFYLHRFDRYIEEFRGVHGYLRYMDDFICFSDSKEDLKTLLEAIRIFAKERLKLELKEKVTTLAPVSEGVPFLGFRVYRNLIRLQRKNLNRMKRKVRKMEQLYASGLIAQGDLTQSVQSMIGHVRHADSRSIRRDMFNSSFKLG